MPAEAAVANRTLSPMPRQPRGPWIAACFAERAAAGLPLGHGRNPTYTLPPPYPARRPFEAGPAPTRWNNRIGNKAPRAQERYRPWLPFPSQSGAIAQGYF